MELRTLMVFCSYTNRSGLTWVGLQTVGKRLSVSKARASVLTKALTHKGYIKVVYQGFRAERADTRQVIFNSKVSLEDIVANTSDPAPYMIEQQQKLQSNQQLKENSMSKRKQIKVNSTVLTDLEKIDCQQTSDRMTIDEMIAIRRSVGDEVFEVALSRAGTGASIEQIQAELRRMLS